MISKRRKTTTLRKNQRKRSNRRLNKRSKKFQMRGGKDIYFDIYYKGSKTNCILTDDIRKKRIEKLKDIIDKFNSTLQEPIKYTYDHLDKIIAEAEKEIIFKTCRIYSHNSFNSQIIYDHFIEPAIQEYYEVGVTIENLLRVSYSLKTIEEVIPLTETKLKKISTNLKNDGFEARVLKKLGFSLDQLKTAGYSVKQLNDVGFSLAQLKTAGYTLDQFKADGYTTLQELLNARFAVSELKNAGYNKVTDFADFRYTYNQLIPAGFTLRELLDAGIQIEPHKLQKDGFHASILLEAGIDLDTVIKAGFPASELKDAGFNAKQLKAGGFSAKQLKDAGFSEQALKDAEFEIHDLYLVLILQTIDSYLIDDPEITETVSVDDPDYGVRQTTNTFYKNFELDKTSLCSELRNLQFTVKDMMDNLTEITAGRIDTIKNKIVKYLEPIQIRIPKLYTYFDSPNNLYITKKYILDSYSTDERTSVIVTELKDAGFTPNDFYGSDFSIDVLQKAGFDLVALKAAGRKVGELIAAGFDLNQLKAAGFSAINFKEASISATELKDMGFNLNELKAAGFEAPELRTVAGFDLSALKAAGFSAIYLKTAKFDAGELKAVGFDLDALKAAGFEALDLKNAGFDLDALKVAGFEAPELKVAGFNLVELKVAGFDAAALKVAGFKVPELKAVGFDAAALKVAKFDAKQLQAAEFEDEDVINAGFPINELIDAGYTLKQLVTLKKDVPFTLDNLNKSYNLINDEYDLDEIFQNGKYNYGDIKKMYTLLKKENEDSLKTIKESKSNQTNNVELKKLVEIGTKLEAIKGKFKKSAEEKCPYTKKMLEKKHRCDNCMYNESSTPLKKDNCDA